MESVTVRDGGSQPGLPNQQSKRWSVPEAMGTFLTRVCCATKCVSTTLVTSRSLRQTQHSETPLHRRRDLKLQMLPPQGRGKPRRAIHDLEQSSPQRLHVPLLCRTAVGLSRHRIV